MTTQRGGASSSSSPPGDSSAATVSPAAAAAASSPGKPELPWAFIDCPTDTLIVLIAHMLELLCQHNDQVLLTPDALTRFHSRASPGITIVDYLRRIVKYTNLEKIPLLSLLAYIDLTCQNLPTFTLSSLTVHRFLIAGVTAGSKAQCDVFCTNSHYAKVGGIKVGELNSLEREFLRVTGWALCCNADLLQRYYTSLIRSHGGFTQAPEPAESPFMAFPLAGEPAPAASLPVTPADSGTDEAQVLVVSAAASDDAGGEVDMADAEAEDAASDVDDDAAVAAPLSGRVESNGDSSADARGRPRTRYDPAAAAAAMEVDVASPREKSAGGGGGLKSLVGGIFGRRDHPSGQAHDRHASTMAPPPPGTASAASATPTNGATPEDLPKPLTPRVRTRDERSVESIRSVPGAPAGALPSAVLVDDGKRRARGG